jgi:hypothetical protein
VLLQLSRPLAPSGSANSCQTAVAVDSCALIDSCEVSADALCAGC